MSWSRVAFSVVVVIIFVSSVFFAVRNTEMNTAVTLPAPAPAPALPATTPPPASPAPPAGYTVIPAATATPGPAPHFYRTITFGSNRSSALTEEQAWQAAETFFAKEGMAGIRASEVEALGEEIRSAPGNPEEMVWGFRLNRTAGSAAAGGVIVIDASDGHVVEFTGSR